MEPTSSLSEEIPEETVSVADPPLPGEHVIDMEEVALSLESEKPAEAERQRSRATCLNMERFQSSLLPLLVLILATLLCAVPAMMSEKCRLLLAGERLLLADERLLLADERRNSSLLRAENQRQAAILSSELVAFLWRFCDRETLECTRCLPGWVEHDNRCFFTSRKKEKWQEARRTCFGLGGDLAVVLNADDQAFLTNLTFHVEPRTREGVWIGLQDLVKEGVFLWVNGQRLKRGGAYWQQRAPNNAVASWDYTNAGQDCVGIVPPLEVGAANWTMSWDDIVCGGRRHYICETLALDLN